jgi:hypothetical protein
MLFCKNAHKGTFIKQIIPGNFGDWGFGQSPIPNPHYKEIYN